MWPDSLSDPAWQGIGAILAFLALVAVALPAGVGIVRKRRQRAEEEREVIRRLLVYLDRRRLLTIPVGRVAGEPPGWSADSALDIKTRVVDDIQNLNENSDALPTLEKMLDICFQFLTKNHQFQESPPRNEDWSAYEKAINDLQEAFKMHTKELRSKYGIAKKPDNGGEDRNGQGRD